MREDDSFMKEVFEHAKKGMGHVAPNPLVGALLVKDEIVIATGHHHHYGGPHAEADVFSNVPSCYKDMIEGSVLYCNLEPCCHENKQTPPCVPLIISHKIKKVVISTLDPNPFVSGEGVKKLREANIEVLEGVLEEEGKKLNEIFFHYIQEKRPFIHIKVAQTLDGKMADFSFNSKWISCELARKEVHCLRLKYDAVMIGMKTLREDNPRLTIRMGVKNEGEAVPWRIVMGTPREEDLNSHLFSDKNCHKTIVALDSQKLSSALIAIFKDRGVSLIHFTHLDNLLMTLGEKKISSVLIEGGSQLVSSFLDQKLFNKLSLYISPTLLGSGLSTYSSGKEVTIDKRLSFKRSHFRFLGDQIVFEADL